MKQFLILITALFFLANGLQHTSAQVYCMPSYTGHGNQFTGVANVADAFFTHIRNVKFSDINHTTGAPTYYGTLAYKDYTYDTGFVAKGGTYTLSIWLGNGANPQTCAVWIDYNQNQVFEASERIFSAFDPQNQGSHIVGGKITIPAGAKTGTTMMRVGTRLNNGMPDPCVNNDPNASTNNWSQDFHDYTIQVQTPTTQSFLSCTANRNVFDEVTMGSTDNLIMGIEVTTNSAGTLSPLTAGYLTFNTLGTTNPTELAAAKLYYTGQNPNFNILNQVGSTKANPNGTYTINANTKLNAGTNFFWLVYDIAGSAVIGNDLSSRCPKIQVSGIDRYPVVTSPSGVRKIGYCISKGSQMNFIGVWGVRLGSIVNNTFGQQFSPYTYYANLRDTLARGTSDTLTVQVGNGINAAKLKAWIDFNRDGDFTDAGELIMDSFNFQNNQANTSYPFIKKGFSIPANAVVGTTRMRVSTQQYNAAKAFTSCTNPTDIGEVEDYSIIISAPGEPVADFKSSISCLGGVTDFYDGSYTFDTFQVNSWDWDFGEPASGSNTSSQQNPSHTYAAGGVYNVKLKVGSNKSGSTPQSITKAVLVEEPVADFNYYPPVFQVPVSFYDNSSGGTMMAWSWDFGDLQSAFNTSGKPNPTHTFDTAGTYTVTLIVITSGGCQDTIVKQVTILQHQVPIADFTAHTFTPYIGAANDLTDQSVNSPGNWKWTITPNKYKYLNSANDSSQNPTVSFDSLTTYTVFLEAKNPAGSHTVSKTFTTKNYTAPKTWLAATPTVARVGEQISFIDSSDNDPTAWEWQFGDSTGLIQSTVQYPTHSYNKAGSYTVQLKASNPAGVDSASRAQYITVTNGFNMCDNTATTTATTAGLICDSGGPNANYNDGSNCGFLIKPNCSGKIVLAFTKFDMMANDLLKVYDGEDDITGKPLHTGNGFTGNAIPGTFVCTSGAIFIKEITDGTGNSSGFAASWTAFVNQIPNPKILNDSVWYVNSPLTIKNGTTLGAGNRYEWDFENDGVVDDTISISPKIIYPVVGKYSIKLLVSNCIGKDSVYFTVNIKTPTQVPVANFVADRDTVLPIDEIQLTDLTTNGPSSWFWEFTPAGHEFYPLGENEFTQSPRIGFVDPGNYSVCLTSTNSIGNSQKVCKTNYIVVKEKMYMCVFPYSSNVAAGKFVDEGDVNNGYNDNSSCDMLLNPCAEELYLNFKSFDLGSGDYLRIYDGSDLSGIPLFSGSGYTGTTIPGPFTSYTGNLFIEFTSDASVRGQGWEAEWTSKAPAAANASFTSPAIVYANGFNYFKNTTAGGKGLSYEWYVDGNLESNVRNFDFRGFSAGSHTVLLIVANCLGADSAMVTVNAINATTKPTVDYTVDIQNPDTQQVIAFMDKSTNGPNSWDWTITPSSGVNWLNGDTLPYPMVSFTDTGWYEVCLTASNGIGSDKLCQTNYIHVLGYCKPGPGTSQSVGITKLILNGFSNNTPIDVGYADYTNQGTITTLERRSSYTITLEKNIAGTNQNWRAWMDWNRDGDFLDAGEQVLSQPSTSNLSVTSSFKVPNVSLGQVRLRVSASYVANANTPCFVSFGDVEDYLLDLGDDKTKPVITILGNNPKQLEQGYNYTDAGATAQDNVDGNITTAIVSTSNVNNMVIGNYQVKYTVSDSAGNKADEAIRDVEVTADITGPSIALVGKDTEMIQVFYTFTEKGYISNDLVDGNTTALVIVTGTVDTTKLGSYSKIYSVTDSKGNTRNKTRVIEVKDTMRPTIILIGTDTVKLTFNTTWNDPGTTVTDNYDLGLAATVIGTVNNNLKGFYTLTYTAEDLSGNKAQSKKRVVEVEYALGVSNVLNANNITLYPNPAKQMAYLEVNLPDDMKNQVNLCLMNALGQCVLNTGPQQLQGSRYIINLDGMAAGMYLVQVSNGKEIYTLKLVKE